MDPSLPCDRPTAGSVPDQVTSRILIPVIPKAGSVSFALAYSRCPQRVREWRQTGTRRGAFVETSRYLNSNGLEYSDRRTAPRSGTEDGGFLPNPSLRVPYSDAIKRTCDGACFDHTGLGKTIKQLFARKLLETINGRASAIWSRTPALKRRGPDKPFIASSEHLTIAR
jgi:hypothetical protein